MICPSNAHLVKQNLHLPKVAIATMPIPPHRIDDAFSAANFALVKAAEKFDVSRGVPFAPWAIRKIRWAVKSELRDGTWGGRYTAVEMASIDDRTDGQIPISARLVDPARSPLISAHAAEIRDLVNQILAPYPELQHLLTRYLFDNLSLDELARELGLVESGLSRQLAIGLDILRASPRLRRAAGSPTLIRLDPDRIRYLIHGTVYSVRSA